MGAVFTGPDRPTCRAALSLGPLRVVVESDIPGPVRDVTAIYSGADTPPPPGDPPEPGTATMVYQVQRDDPAAAGAARYRISRDGETLRQQARENELSRYLEWHITDVASRALRGYHLVHAGGLALNGHGLLMPAASGSGKSTTTAALALGGFDYCSDELAVIGADARLRPFPKIISLKAGGWQEISRQFAGEVSRLGWPNASGGGAWQVKPPRLPDESQAEAGYPIDLVILPRHDASQDTSLQPITRSEAIKEIVDQSMDLQRWGAAGLDLLVRVVQRADCYLLCSNQLEQSVALVRELVG